ncbi:Na(+)-translocating ferredoxin:NAD(+) oxidoreductase complex subunit D [Petrocella atlantisensis]|uniref:Ion-translocating oxidoreductase complex subunit D n=1 Tax=Petrocella atlantisensis TaxID=2173034 RepID=A0A3P7PRX5_9FIRM|nr:RnfABCDGE type electron transport complex subunit D [Petrocella atlantisensis]VDN45951.1 Na(+)-translocating ferredoxin:NAD(+) oxidoreductase complex subunit D [Petrocella atlantisensis]
MSDMYIVSSSPHIKSKDSIQKTMLDVLIALTPAALFAIYYFGVGALSTIFICILSSVFAEWGYTKLMKQRNTAMDLSAAVTGLLLALNLPSSIPWWVSVMGSFFAIIIVKQLFGGLGQNFMNPALAARAFLLISFTGLMTTWGIVDGVSAATPLGIIKEGGQMMPSLLDTFIGTIPGSLGETSALALIIGGLYLMVRKVISWRIPIIYIVTTALMVLLFGGEGFDLTYLGYHIFSGGLMIGAFFMATDYSSSPTTPKGQIIMGLGCGILTALIRLFGGYPEGVSFAILIMNLFVPLIDKYTVPKSFGEVAK